MRLDSSYFSLSPWHRRLLVAGTAAFLMVLVALVALFARHVCGIASRLLESGTHEPSQGRPAPK